MGQRLIITEEERNSIIRLHKSNIFESGPAGQDPELQQAASSTQPPAATPQQSKTSQKIMDLQNKLNEKFNSGLIADGKWGFKTAAAVLSAMKSLSNTQPKPTEEPLQKMATLPASAVGTVRRSTPAS